MDGEGTVYNSNFDKQNKKKVCCFLIIHSRITITQRRNNVSRWRGRTDEKTFTPIV
ncbi:Uncharacterized protein APZ42_005285 [Daphnia magna]|uniref:Uncharacterized protein n=1 Tax=Daphnia magna TaxID=35525 RepID=A0A164GJ99_9CRUS|nr:Uncharacterized protein APZ42_005285 [Daphnia magna]